MDWYYQKSGWFSGSRDVSACNQRVGGREQEDESDRGFADTDSHNSQSRHVYYV